MIIARPSAESKLYPVIFQAHEDCFDNEARIVLSALTQYWKSEHLAKHRSPHFVEDQFRASGALHLKRELQEVANETNAEIGQRDADSEPVKIALDSLVLMHTALRSFTKGQITDVNPSDYVRTMLYRSVGRDMIATIEQVAKDDLRQDAKLLGQEPNSLVGFR